MSIIDQTPAPVNATPARPFVPCDRCPGDGPCRCEGSGWEAALDDIAVATSRQRHDERERVARSVVAGREFDRRAADRTERLHGDLRRLAREWGLDDHDGIVSPEDRAWWAAVANDGDPGHDPDGIAPETDGVPADYARWAAYYEDRAETERIEDAEYEARIRFGSAAW